MFARSYQIYYSQATANARRGTELKMINWWSTVDGLVRFPLLPPTKRVYTNFEGRHFVVPVLHVRIKRNVFMCVYIDPLILVNDYYPYDLLFG